MTAYDMRIRDRSSDVCSSDLLGRIAGDQEEGVELAGDQSFHRVVGLEGGHLDGAFGETEGFWQQAGADQGARAGLVQRHALAGEVEIGRASCRERVCQYV